MRAFSDVERRQRLVHRQFLSLPDTVSAVTARLIGLHATDPATPFLSLWARLPGFVVPDLEDALYERRSVVRHLAMRRTLWVVSADDLSLVQAAASDRVAVNEHRRLVGDVRKAGITDDGDGWLERAIEAVLGHLGRHGAHTSTELRAALPELAGTYDPAPGRSWGGPVPVAPRVLTVLSSRGEIVRGPNDGAWTSSRPRWTRTTDWLGERVERTDAHEELVRRWLYTFGPATITDITWWFGDTLTATRKALSDIGAVEVELATGPGYALPDDLDAEPESPPTAALLPGLDPTTMGWSDRDWYLGAHRSQLFDRSGNAGPTAWWDGQIVGGWHQDAAAQVQLQLLEDPGRDGRNALQDKAAQLTAWLDGVPIRPRFPSPLSKATPKR